jgi:hypothetical protein
LRRWVIACLIVWWWDVFLPKQIDFKQTATGAHLPCGRRFFCAGHGFAHGFFDSRLGCLPVCMFFFTRQGEKEHIEE